jgi:hypothetical protein
MDLIKNIRYRQGIDKNGPRQKPPSLEVPCPYRERLHSTEGSLSYSKSVVNLAVNLRVSRDNHIVDKENAWSTQYRSQPRLHAVKESVGDLNLRLRLVTLTHLV